MTIAFLLVCLALAGYAVFTRRRHLRLKEACQAAFDRCHGATAPPPRYEMSYSYGEPVFQVMFASRQDFQAAAGANAAFLQEIDALCKSRGRKRQFKAQRSVFFQHPKDEEQAVRHCCATMRAQVGQSIAYTEDARLYGLRTSKVGTPPLAIAHCPWCGATLPPRG